MDASTSRTSAVGFLEQQLAEKRSQVAVHEESMGSLQTAFESAQLLKEKGTVYAPDFIANAGGLIRLAGLYLGLTEDEIDQKVERIEKTTLEVLSDTRKYASAYDAAAKSAANG